jgi:rhamnulokinase
MTHCLAVDFGASSLRLIDIGLKDGRLSLCELARSANGPFIDAGKLVWDYDRIFAWLGAALAAATETSVAYAGIGADSWGVDYVLLDEKGERIGPAVCYRDRRTDGAIARFAAECLSETALYSATGIPSLSINTLYQLYAQSLMEPDTLRKCRRLLFTADYVHYWLSGVAANERTLSSTSQMLTLAGDWWGETVAAVGLPAAALAKPVHPGTVLGSVARLTGPKAAVIAPASHDTQSAILAVAVEDGADDWAYLSSGTWSILGVESKTPLAGAPALAAGFGNEAGFDGTFCIQTTVTGLWLVQEVRRVLGGNFSDGDLAALAGSVAPFRSLIDPEDPRFLAPANMVVEIRAATREHGEPVPDSPAELVRCAYDSLALFYRSKIAQLSALTGRTIARLHVVGGGSKAALLNRLCAGATGLPVLAGPAEATALGNGLAQLVALGTVADATAARRLIAASFAPIRYDPVVPPGLDDAIARFEKISRK